MILSCEAESMEHCVAHRLSRYCPGVGA
jgi:hypothetical protein